MQHQRQILRQRQRRAIRVRNRVKRDASRPRLAIFRSHQNIYAQIIDDYAGRTLVSAASTLTDVRGELKNGGNIAAAKKVGLAIANRAKEKGISAVCFDRGGNRYHGRIKALADAARAGGLKF